METIIYHGSHTVIKYPYIIVGKNTKDFGYGFYCTRIKEQAGMLVNKYKTSVINSYKVDNLLDLKVKVFEEYNEEWLDFIVHCRNGGEHHYDVVEGFMCDDIMWDNLDEYINGYIDKVSLLDMMKFRWCNNQISFHTIRALKRIKSINSEEIRR